VLSGDVGCVAGLVGTAGLLNPGWETVCNVTFVCHRYSLMRAFRGGRNGRTRVCCGICQGFLGAAIELAILWTNLMHRCVNKLGVFGIVLVLIDSGAHAAY